MTREQKTKIMMEILDDQAASIPGYLEDDYRDAIMAAFGKIEKLEKLENETPGAATPRESR